MLAHASLLVSSGLQTGTFFRFSRSFAASAANLKYKLKTHSGTKKRWTALPNGLFKRGKVGKVHLNTHKGSARVNSLAQTAYSIPSQTARLKRLMPYV
ncbi:hypothetical protein FRB96_001490 [Tulasnella sp. 330]|nr:hypothetical protein FRB96_001490 [Tulasnella sp. 330]KAG8886639.1 hypothetical protein FRB97_000059 [Tulasnella sp. 331]KAG8890668.1 hypothetical protein FRB98_006171 [Tulasnella sp. 332]